MRSVRRLARRWQQAFLNFHMTRPLTALAIWTVLAALSIVYTLGHLRFESSQRDLISSNNRLMQRLKVADRFSSLDAFVVAIENRDTGRTIDFARRLASTLANDRTHYTQVFYHIDPSALRPWALLYLSENDLHSLLGRLDEHQAFIRSFAGSPGLVSFMEAVNGEMTSSMVGQLFTGFLEPKGPGGKTPLDLGFLIDTLKDLKKAEAGATAFTSPLLRFFDLGFNGESQEEYFWTGGRKYLVMSVTPRPGEKGRDAAKEDLASLRKAIAGVKAEFPDVSAGVTGPKALDEDEKSQATRDIGTATALSLVALPLLLVIFWRNVKWPLLEMAVLVIALCLTLGLTTLTIGHLNLLSVTFAPMLLGLGIDYGIHWFARYDEVRRRSTAPTVEVLRSTMDLVGGAILIAGLCAALSFFPLVLTWFKGLSELGLICGMGMGLTTAATLSLLPVLVALLGRFQKRAVPRPSKGGARPLFTTSRAVAVCLMALAAVSAGLSVRAATGISFDLNMLHLQSRDAESVVWERKLIRASGYASIYGVLFSHSFKGIEEKTKALEGLPTVSRVMSVLDLLPSHQEQKIELLKEIRQSLPDRPIAVPRGPVDVGRLDNVLSRISFKMAGAQGAGPRLAAQMEEAKGLIDDVRHGFRAVRRPELLERLKRLEVFIIGDLNDKLSVLRENMDTRPMVVSDLPAPLRERFVGPDDLYLIRVFPKGDVWEPRFLHTFVRDLQSVDPDATGDPVTLSVFTEAFRDACFKGAAYAVLFIIAFLGFTLWSPVSILAALTPFVLGTLWTFGLMRLFRIDLNLANSIFMPLVVGAGVEYGIIIIKRWSERPDRTRFSLPASTGGGVILAGLTTTVGFASLIISRHQGIQSLGLLTTIGSLSVLTAAVFFLPALLHLMSAARNGKKGDGRTAPTEDKHKEET